MTHPQKRAVARAVVPSVWVVKGEHAWGAELRNDGWPICPYCDEDELASLQVPATVESISLCYKCGPISVVVS